MLCCAWADHLHQTRHRLDSARPPISQKLQEILAHCNPGGLQGGAANVGRAALYCSCSTVPAGAAMVVLLEHGGGVAGMSSLEEKEQGWRVRGEGSLLQKVRCPVAA